jgi:hypothetical protein
VFWRVVEILLGLLVIGVALSSTEFEPIGWTTGLIWGSGKNARVPRWIAGSLYFVLGAILLYVGITGK